MLTPKNAVRIISTPNGKRYFHTCERCKKEIGPNSVTHLKTRSGLCNRCFKTQQHHPGQRLLTRIKTSARGRTDVTLTLEECAFLQEIAVCCYCGNKVDWTKKSRINLDRINPLNGYSIDNVVVCCFECNRIKSNLLSGNEMRLVGLLLRYYRNTRRQDQEELEYALVRLVDESANIMPV